MSHGELIILLALLLVLSDRAYTLMQTSDCGGNAVCAAGILTAGQMEID